MKTFLSVLFILHITSSFGQTKIGSANLDDETPLNIVFVDPFQLIWKNVGVGYEYFDKPNNKGYRATLIKGLGSGYTEIGLEYRIYLTDASYSSYSLGPLDLGELTVDWFLGPAIHFFSQRPGPDKVITPGVTGGLMIQSIKGFNFSAFGMLGGNIYVQHKSPIPKNVFYDQIIGFSVGWAIESQKQQ